MHAEFLRNFGYRLQTRTASKPTFALNSAVCTPRFLPSLIYYHPFTDDSLNHRLRSGVHYTIKYDLIYTNMVNFPHGNLEC